VIVVDANLLLYAVNRDLPQHEVARAWWEGVLSRNTPVGLAWGVLLAFLRISTHPRIFERPLKVEAAAAYLDGWLAMPGVRTISPMTRHWEIVRALLVQSGTGGNLTSDAHLAAMTIEHGGTLHSADNDFKRYAGLLHINPLGRP
jgi:toxin-antitoxin system PIN domain toxin